MSTEENKALVLRYFEEVWGKGDFAVEQEVFATDFIDHNPYPSQPSGLEGHHHVVVLIRNAFPDFQYTLEEMIADQDKVVDRLTFRATHTGLFMNIPPTGKQVTFTGIDIIRFEGGKIVELWHQEDMLGLLQQLGVIPPMGQAS